MGRLRWLLVLALPFAPGCYSFTPASLAIEPPSITGRYPNAGPMLLCRAGIPLVDDAGDEVMDAVVEGAPVTVDGDRVLVGGTEVARGTRQSVERVGAALDDARDNLGPELERFAVNTADYVRREIDLLIDDLDVPELDSARQSIQRSPKLRIVPAQGVCDARVAVVDSGETQRQRDGAGGDRLDDRVVRAGNRFEILE